MIERWLPVPGYEGRYEVSDLGRVRSTRRTGIMRPANVRASAQPNGKPFWQIKLWDGECYTGFVVSRLVLTAFVGPCPDGMEACHWDDDPNNNALSNLRWDTRSANVLDQVRNGNHACARKQECDLGHPLDYVRPRGGRRCRRCNTEAQRRRRARLKMSATSNTLEAD